MRTLVIRDIVWFSFNIIIKINHENCNWIYWYDRWTSHDFWGLSDDKKISWKITGTSNIQMTIRLLNKYSSINMHYILMAWNGVKDFDPIIHLWWILFPINNVIDSSVYRNFRIYPTRQRKFLSSACKTLVSWELAFKVLPFPFEDALILPNMRPIICISWLEIGNLILAWLISIETRWVHVAL